MTGLSKGGDNVEAGSFCNYGYPPGKAPCNGHMCPVLKILIISYANLHKVSIFP